MKLSIAILAGLAATSLTACAPMSGSSPGMEAQVYAPTDTTFVGWVRFSREEFQLNADQDQVLRPLGRPCVSGALSRDLMRQYSPALQNQKVRIVGRTQTWSQDLPGDRIDFQGSNIRNECGGDFVILADTITPIP